MVNGAEIVAVIRSALAAPAHAIAYELTVRLAAIFEGAFVLESEDGDFEVERFAQAGHGTVEALPGMVRRATHYWRDGTQWQAHIGAYTLQWRHEGETIAFTYVLVEWSNDSCHTRKRYLVAPARERAEAFFTAVCRWSSNLAGTVLVFDRGHWQKNRPLYADIQKTRLADLILPPGRREEIVGDLQRFIDRKGEYDRLAVPWKRGILLSGPPGNGKTMCIKALANSLRVPAGEVSRPIDCLYVRSLVAQHTPEHYTIGEIFDRARRSQPCLLIFEDLDSLVTDRNRSVFLNELDGLAINSGIIAIASTNHAEQLDPALRDRPSRFDRTWHFELPGAAERESFLVAWRERSESTMRLNDGDCRRVAAATHGFSFAYLKELMISSLMRWIDAGDASVALANVVAPQVDLLRAQMAESVTPPGTASGLAHAEEEPT